MGNVQFICFFKEDSGSLAFWERPYSYEEFDTTTFATSYFNLVACTNLEHRKF